MYISILWPGTIIISYVNKMKESLKQNEPHSSDDDFSPHMQTYKYNTDIYIHPNISVATFGICSVCPTMLYISLVSRGLL